MSELLPRQRFSTACYCCGTENPEGLKLRFRKDSDGAVSTEFTAPAHWTGWGKIMHGGFQSLLLDETMSWAVWAAFEGRGQFFVTKEIRLEFAQPVHVQTPLAVCGHLVSDDGHAVKTRGEIKDAGGKVLTRAEGVLVRVSDEKLREKSGGNQ